MKDLFKLVITILAITGINNLYAQEKKLIADFNDVAQPVNAGGELGTWDKFPEDNTQTCKATIVPDVYYGDKGHSWKVEYDVDSPNPAFNGIYLKFKGIDLSKYKYLTFQLKGDKAKGYPKRVKVELKTNAESGSYYISNIKGDWKKFSIPFKFFKIKNLKDVKELTFVFEDKTSEQKTGIIYLDEIAVENK